MKYIASIIVLSTLLSPYAMSSPVTDAGIKQIGQTAKPIQRNIRYRNWESVASSDAIVTGTLQVPLKQINDLKKKNQSDYVFLELSNVTIIKGGQQEKNIQIRHNIDVSKKSSADHPLSTLYALNGKQVIAYLVFASEYDGITTTVTSYLQQEPTALASYTEKEKKLIQNEIASQASISKINLSPLYKDNVMHGKVKQIISRIMNKNTAQQAYIDLESLGKGASPYIIMHLNDIRKIPVPNISLTNKNPHAFEGRSHHSTPLLSDVLLAILGQIEGQSFSTGEIVTQEKRNAIINAWKTWLIYQR